MNKSESISDLAKSLAKAQSEFPAIAKSREVRVKSDKGSYSFAYAPLDAIVEQIRPVLFGNELSYTQGVCGDGLVTLIMHSSGQWIEYDMPIGRPAKPQEYGSLLTYMKRYALCAALGIVSEEDDDGNAANGDHVDAKNDRPARGQQAKAASTTPESAADMAIIEQMQSAQTVPALVEIMNGLTKEQKAAANAAFTQRMKELKKAA